MSRFEIIDWITPGSLVLSIKGALDPACCHEVESRMRQLQAECPGIRLTLELGGVTAVDEAAAEDMLLHVIVSRARGGSLQIACPSTACQPLLRRLNVEHLPAVPAEEPVGGVTA